MASTRVSMQATSSRPNHERLHTVVEDSFAEHKLIDMEGALDEVAEDEEMFDEDVKPLAKKKSSDKKNRPTSGQFIGVEHKILDEAVLQVVRLFAIREPCPEPEEYELMIDEAWDNAVTHRRQRLEDWSITREHITCIKQRVNSWRGRVHRRVALGIAGAYNFMPSPENTPAVVQARAIALSNKSFHRNPNPAEPGVIGNYTHPYFGQAIYLIYFVGLIPVGTHFKSEFKVMPLATIAYATGLIETFIKRYRVDGLFDTQKKVTVGQIQADVLKHH
ncbi:hypothetical protein FS749_006839 [Ceratobasidium sp. UAMH 11750]|nr:hypothetical protein FS749_006839 [Ceratobasidium sp. UAMH 11750]